MTEEEFNDECALKYYITPEAREALSQVDSNLSDSGDRIKAALRFLAK
jgi:hypothetical protein